MDNVHELAPSGVARTWLVRTDTAPGNDAAEGSVLDEAERRRAAAFRFERDRRRYVASHLALRGILAETLGSRPGELRFSNLTGVRLVIGDHHSGLVNACGARKAIAAGRSLRAEPSAVAEMLHG
ncbi:hypothetical protein [Streptomyces sp. NPDC055681]